MDDVMSGFNDKVSVQMRRENTLEEEMRKIIVNGFV